MLGRAIAFVLAPVLRLMLRWTPVEDPWDRDDGQIALAFFGPAGSRKDFGWYFEGESGVRVRSLEDIQEWLEGCAYTSDLDLFQETDFWQHPRTFERTRRGDCEDFALWAWRQLLELGYDADFVIGRAMGARRSIPGNPGGHAWVMFRREGQSYIYEPACKTRAKAVRPFEEVRDQYIPTFGVGPNRKRFGFAGYFVVLSQRLDDQPPETSNRGR